jgi:acetate kinase
MSILTLNGGSSSLKMGLFEDEGKTRIASASVDRIGSADARVTFRGDPETKDEDTRAVRDHGEALDLLFERLKSDGKLEAVGAVGHRIVHGGPRFHASCALDGDVVEELRRLAPIDPDHLPAEIAIVEAVTRRMPRTPQVACFDTTFHRTMPRVARLLPLPAEYAAKGLERYGFHGLSYTFLLGELERVAGERVARGRTIFAHLGSGSSLAAVRDGRCVETTMGFSPTSGVVMGTRTGDLDPGVAVYLLRHEKMSADAFDELVNKKAGLLGVSGSSADMRDLLAREKNDSRAADAVALYCYSVRKAIGALAATIDGLDTLVFSGGIGENGAPVRARIVEGLGYLGVAIEPARNEAGKPVISPEVSPCTVRVMKTDEESVIARETARIAFGERGRAS